MTILLVFTVFFGLLFVEVFLYSGLSTRLWVLVVSQACAAPLAAMVLYLSPPYCFVALLGAYLFGKLLFFVIYTLLVVLSRFYYYVKCYQISTIFLEILVQLQICIQ